MKITFLGAASTVTGSKHLLSVNEKNFLIDCGQLQGPDETLLKNNLDGAFNLDLISKIHAIFITHAHIDHCGFLPYIVRKGFLGPIYTTLETFELMKISLNDAANLLREAVKPEDRKKKFFFDKNDVHTMLTKVKIVKENEENSAFDVKFKFYKSCHILGSCFIKFQYNDKSIVFSGDLGRQESILHNKPDVFEACDCLVLESTYGNKFHSKKSIEDYFVNLFDEVLKKGSTLIIPAFSIDRTQMLLNIMTKVVSDKELNLPIILTGSMGIEVTKVYEKYSNQLKIDQSDFERIYKYTRVIEFQNELEHFWEKSSGAKIVIAGGGMLSGGTIVGHLKHFGVEANNLILITGYQAKETVGRTLLDGEKNIELESIVYNIKAEVRFLEGLSAHADQNDIFDWISQSLAPKTIFLVHGEEESRLGLQQKIEDVLKIRVITPKEGESFNLRGDKA